MANQVACHTHIGSTYDTRRLFDGHLRNLKNETLEAWNTVMVSWWMQEQD